MPNIPYFSTELGCGPSSKSHYSKRFEKWLASCGGRKAGTRNVFTQNLKDEIIGAAVDVGMIREEPIVDKEGKQLGGTRLLATGQDGLRGYLRWAAINKAESFIGLLGRVLPSTLNVKTDTKVTVEYGTMEEKRAALLERGIDPDALEQAMRPKFLLELQSNSSEEAAE